MEATLKLSAKHEDFCREYIVDRNATQAYIRAGYSKKSADTAASRLYGNVKVQARIAELTEKAAIRNDLRVDDIIQVWKGVIESGDDETTQNKLIAARDAGKHLGMFVDRVDHTTKGESMNTHQQEDINDAKDEILAAIESKSG